VASLSVVKGINDGVESKSFLLLGSKLHRHSRCELSHSLNLFLNLLCLLKLDVPFFLSVHDALLQFNLLDQSLGNVLFGLFLDVGDCCLSSSKRCTG
jgi:hypothetical protein